MTTAIQSSHTNATILTYQGSAGEAAQLNTGRSQKTAANGTNDSRSTSSAFSSPAVEVSLSPEARAALERLDKVHAFTESGEEYLSEEYLSNAREIGEINLAVWKQQFAATVLPDLRARYEALLKTEPKPAVELTGKDKEAAWALARKLGHTPWGDNYTFVHENLMYTFKSDGRVTVHDGDVPTSEEFKQQVLSSMSKRIAQMEANISYDVEEAVERRNALLARQAELKSS